MMGDRECRKILIPYTRRRKKAIPKRSVSYLVASETENVEVKKARVCESVAEEEEEEGNGNEIDGTENEGIVEKTAFSWETEVDLGGIEVKEEKSQVDLNREFLGSEVVEEGESEIGFRDCAALRTLVDEKNLEVIFVDSDDHEGQSERLVEERDSIEEDPFDDEGDLINRKRRYNREEKGKGKVVDNRNRLSIGSDGSDFGTAEIGLSVDGSDYMSGKRRCSEEGKGNAKIVDNWLSIGIDSNAADWETSEVGFDDVAFSNLRRQLCENEKEEALVDLEKRKREALSDVKSRARKRREDAKRIIKSGTEFAHGKEENLIGSSTQKKDMSSLENVRELEVTANPFSIALKKIKERNFKLNAQKKTLLIEWMPSRHQDQDTLETHVPSLLDLSIDELAKNAHDIVSLEPVPDALKHTLSSAICDSRKMNGHFLKLLMSGSPTEIRVPDCSWMTEEEFSGIFQKWNTKNMRVLQLDLCGRCLPDDTLSDTLAWSLNCFPALATISLRCASRLSDFGIKELTLSAPSLQSINLGQCSLLTSASIYTLANCLGSLLKELYIDDCQNIDAWEILAALEKFEHLELLSVAGIATVSDAFVSEFVTARGQNMKELILADCVTLTDMSLKIIGKSCNQLCALDLSKLDKLTDSALQYLADGCRLIQVLKLSGTGFSDEAIAAFLEVSGTSLKELSLNYVTKVGPNTALSLSKYSRSLLSLDLSWCRKLTDEALGLIVDSCLLLRLLKLFGCSQITDVFLNGHSNSSVRIIGLQNLPLLKHLNVLESQTAPLRYSPIVDYTKPRSKLRRSIPH